MITLSGFEFMRDLLIESEKALQDAFATNVNILSFALSLPLLVTHTYDYAKLKYKVTNSLFLFHSFLSIKIMF
jgi:hypothetical protein